MELDIKTDLDLEGITSTAVGDDQKTEIEKMIESLEAVDVTTDEDLQGKLQASQQTGHLANQLGETREQLRELREVVANQPNAQPQTVPTEDIFGTPVPAGGITEDRLIEVLDKRDQAKVQVATQARKYAVDQYNAITRDKHYPVVKAVWDAKMRDPVFANAIDTGQINPISAYQSTVIEFLTGVNTKTLETLKGVIKTPGENENVDLHLEGGDRSVDSTPTLPGATPIKDTGDVQKYQDHINKGGRLNQDQEIDMLAKVMSQT